MYELPNKNIIIFKKVPLPAFLYLKVPPPSTLKWVCILICVGILFTYVEEYGFSKGIPVLKYVGLLKYVGPIEQPRIGFAERKVPPCIIFPSLLYSRIFDRLIV